MDSIQSVITEHEHVAILLEQFYLFHFRGYPLHTLSLEIKAERVPELDKAATAAAKQLVAPFISALHAMNRSLNGDNQKSSKNQKQFNLPLEEN